MANKRKLSEVSDRSEARTSSVSGDQDVKRIKTEAVSLDFMSVCESELIEILEQYTTTKEGDNVAHQAEIALLLNGMLQRDNRCSLWSPCNYATLVRGVFSLLKLHPTYQPEIELYEFLIELHTSLEPTTSIRSLRDMPHFDKSLATLVKLVRAASIENVTAFQTALINVINLHSIYSVYNATICTLVVALVDIGSANNRLLQRFYVAVNDALETFLLCREQTWVATSLSKKIHSWRMIGNLMRYFNMCKYMNERVATTNLIEIATYLLDKTPPPDHYNAYLIQPRTASQSSSLLAASLLREMILDSHTARLQVLDCLVGKIFSEDTSQEHRNHYIEQLEVLLNESYTINAVYNSSADQRNDLEELKAKLDELLCSEDAIVNLFRLGESQAQRLIAAFRVFIYYDDRSDALSLTIKLKNSLIERCNNINSNEVTKATACRCLMTILKTVNKNPLGEQADTERAEPAGLDRAELHSRHRDLSIELIEYIRSLIMLPVGYSSVNILTEVSDRLVGNASIKSYVYQQMYSLIKHNPQLADKVEGFFSSILDRFMIKHKDHAYFDMRKCVIVNGATNIKLIEPLDVLFSCSVLCMRKDNVNVPPRAISLALQTYTFKDAQYIYQIYRNQWREHTASIPITKTSVDFFDDHISQMILGLYDSALEHLIKNDKFSEVPDLMEKYESTKEMIQKDLRCFDLASKFSEVTSKSRKRKLDEVVNAVAEEEEENSVPKRRPPSTRLRVQDKENQAPTVAVKKKPGRPALKNITNTQAACTSGTKRTRATGAQAAALTTQESTSKSDNQSTRVSKSTRIRLSMTSCIRAIRFTTTTVGPSTRFSESPKRELFSFNESIINCITNQPFMNLILGSVEERLNDLLDTSDKFYNPEGLEDESLLNLLADLWSIYSSRINGSNRATSSINNPDTNQFPLSFHKLNGRLIYHCQLIWIIAGQRFQIEQDLLGVKKEGVISVGGARFSPCEELRKFVYNSLQMIKLFIKQPSENQLVASKCCRNLLSLLHHIFCSMDFATRDYDVLIEQFLLMTQSMKDARCQLEATKITIDLANKSTSSLLMTKYVALEIRNKATEVLCRRIAQKTTDERVNSWIETYNLLLPFLINYTTQQLVMFDEMLSNTNDRFYERTKLFKNVNNQLLMIVEIIIHLKRTQSLADELEQAEKVPSIKKSVDKLESQLTRLVSQLALHQDAVKVIGGTENLFVLRELIETISSQLQVKLVDERKRVKDLIRK